MPEQKKKMDLFGRSADVVDIPVKSATEYFNEYVLEDGTLIRVKNVATSFLRIEGQYLPDGRPVFLVLSTPVVNVDSSPVMKKAQ